MPIQDAVKVKERIMSFIRLRGPSLPVQVAKEVGLSILFTSAFLSELYGEKELIMSNLRVGSSRLYLIRGQESQLEKFSQYLKSREKEAFLKLKEKKFLKDSEQEPVIRVALREIKDFAIPFKKDDEIYWRYFVVPTSEFEEDEKGEVQMKKEKIAEEQIILIKKEEKKIENIFDDSKKEINQDMDRNENPVNDNKSYEISKQKEKMIKKEKPKINKSKKVNSKKKDENFFNKIKEFLEKKKIEILDIKDFKNDEAILKIKKDEEELLFVFNKKKVEEKEIIKAHKKASEFGMKYNILSLSEPPKRLMDLVEALKDLSSIEKIE